MPKILIERETQLPPLEAFEKIKTLLSDDKDLRRLDSGYQCQFDVASKKGTAKGRQFTAVMQVQEGLQTGTSTRVELTIELSLVLTPFKGMVETTLKRKLEKILA